MVRFKRRMPLINGMDKHHQKTRKDVWFYVAVIFGMALLFALLVIITAFVYSIITGDKQILSDIFSVFIPLIT